MDKEDVDKTFVFVEGKFLDGIKLLIVDKNKVKLTTLQYASDDL